MKKTLLNNGREHASRTLVLSLGLGLTSLAHASTAAPTQPAPPLLEPVQKIQMLRQWADEGPITAPMLRGIEQEVASSCFGQSPDKNGNCSYSQEPGCNYTQSCGRTA